MSADVVGEQRRSSCCRALAADELEQTRLARSRPTLSCRFPTRPGTAAWSSHSGSLRRQLAHTIHCEVQLEVQRLLRPERAVVIEDRDALRFGDTLRAFDESRSTALLGARPRSTKRGAGAVRCRPSRTSSAPRKDLFAAKALFQLFHYLVEAEARRLLTGRELLEGGEEVDRRTSARERAGKHGRSTNRSTCSRSGPRVRTDRDAG